MLHVVLLSCIQPIKTLKNCQVMFTFIQTDIVPEMLNSVKLCICVCMSVCDRESERDERVALIFINNDSLS